MSLNILINDRVEVQTSPDHYHWGTIQFIGRLKHLSRQGIDNRTYYGIALDQKRGSNNGSIGGDEYFQCAHGFGIFVLDSDIKSMRNQQMKVFVGDKVEINNYGLGTVQWIGRFASNISDSQRLRFGVELDEPYGHHDGVRGGVQYFHCSPRCGVFVDSVDIVSVENSPIPFEIGDEVYVRGYGEGVIRFIGCMDEWPGWIKYGIALFEKNGVHNGVVNGVKYFECRRNRGILVDGKLLQRVQRERRVQRRRRPGANRKANKIVRIEM